MKPVQNHSHTKYPNTVEEEALLTAFFKAKHCLMVCADKVEEEEREDKDTHSHIEIINRAATTFIKLRRTFPFRDKTYMKLLLQAKDLTNSNIALKGLIWVLILAYKDLGHSINFDEEDGQLLQKLVENMTMLESDKKWDTIIELLTLKHNLAYYIPNQYLEPIDTIVLQVSFNRYKVDLKARFKLDLEDFYSPSRNLGRLVKFANSVLTLLPVVEGFVAQCKQEQDLIQKEKNKKREASPDIYILSTPPRPPIVCVTLDA